MQINVYFTKDFNFRIEEDGKLIYERNIKDYGLDILNKIKHIELEGDNSIPEDKMIFIDENHNLKIKFIIISIDGQWDEKKKMQYFII